MAVTVYTEKKTIGDLIRKEYDPGSGYCREKAVVYNRTGGAVTLSDPMGYPVKADASVAGAYKFAMYGDEATVVGLIIDANCRVSALANNGTVTTVILRRGPAVVDQSYIPTKDLADANFVSATLYTALLGLNPPIKALPENPNTVTQLT